MRFGLDGYGLMSLVNPNSPLSVQAFAGRRRSTGNFLIAMRRFARAPSSEARLTRAQVDQKFDDRIAALACSLNRSSMRMCDSRSLRRGSSTPLRPNSMAIARRDRSIETIAVQVSRVVDQALQCFLEAAGNRPAPRRIGPATRATLPRSINAFAYAK